jgi:hypothetical protein
MNKELFSANAEGIKVFYDFNNAEDVFNVYNVSEKEREGIDFIYANYERTDYEGWSFVLFMKNNKMYEVNGSHCSCNGLDECWSPEETSFAAMMFRPNVPLEAKQNLKKLFPNLVVFL